jgi:opacity protein-like surface antigen
MTHWTKTVTAVAFGLATVALPASAQHRDDHEFRLRAGLFEPEGDSDYWDDNVEQYIEEVADYEGPAFGLDYRLGLGGRLGLLFSVDGTEAENTRAYRDFVDERGRDIVNTATLEVTSATVGLMVYLAPTHSPVQPYVGVGGGIYGYTLSEEGEFVDFSDDDAIFDDFFETDGTTLGYYFLAGLDIPVGNQFSLFAEGRWHRAEDDLDGDFDGFGDLDLSSRSITGGVSFKF